MQNFTDQDMRNALSKFATGVTIVTACDADGQKVGMTASSFNSVSMDPPLILWSVRKNALSAEVFKTTKNFSVHILSADQKELSNQFARSGHDKFANVDYTVDQNNVPQITNSLVRFNCITWAVYEGGDHWIIVGHVKGLTTADGDGLVFCNGFYTTTAVIPETTT
ncbi:flavin reductase family protein [Amylibacter sp. SFDW26]|uniref:flavin reductase family protein n=1 Tax=Amylibacter sp. SFDW26 TaxID=2652722 RepID=UPI0012626A19|nr:flavin reductase family protein [Amylibacter sp. SFDW26]KAB7615942.1 flavin reductase family protein [Amylibacter sp. SFDW26]